MLMDHPFEVGREYRNRKGSYEVLIIEGPKMRTRYEAVLTTTQARILETMALEE